METGGRCLGGFYPPFKIFFLLLLFFPFPEGKNIHGVRCELSLEARPRPGYCRASTNTAPPWREALLSHKGPDRSPLTCGGVGPLGKAKYFPSGATGGEGASAPELCLPTVQMEGLPKDRPPPERDVQVTVTSRDKWRLRSKGSGRPTAVSLVPGAQTRICPPQTATWHKCSPATSSSSRHDPRHGLLAQG